LIFPIGKENFMQKFNTGEEFLEQILINGRPLAIRYWISEFDPGSVQIRFDNPLGWKILFRDDQKANPGIEMVNPEDIGTWQADKRWPGNSFRLFTLSADDNGVYPHIFLYGHRKFKGKHFRVCREEFFWVDRQVYLNTQTDKLEVPGLRFWPNLEKVVLEFVDNCNIPKDTFAELPLKAEFLDTRPGVEKLLFLNPLGLHGHEGRTLLEHSDKPISLSLYGYRGNLEEILEKCLWYYPNQCEITIEEDRWGFAPNRVEDLPKP
jgi:hypothetical protein